MSAPTFGQPTSNDFKSHLKDSSDIKTKRLNEVDPTKDINDLPLSALIGGPLIAAIVAMREVTIGTINFVKHQCFDASKADPFKTKTESMLSAQLTAQSGEGWGEPKYLTFEYSKTSQLGATIPAMFRVPLLCMVPVPTLRLEFVTIDFLCKIHTVETKNVGVNQVAALTNTQNTTKNEGGTATKTGDQKTLDPLVSTVGAVSAARVNQKKSSNGSTVSKEYSYNVKVKAVDDEKPPGIEKLMEILDILVKDTSGDDQTFDKMMDGFKAPDLANFNFGAGGGQG